MISSEINLCNLLSRKVFSVCRTQVKSIHNRDKIGNREWVGFGTTGCANYMDRTCFPFPAIRYKEYTNELIALREKERGDWRKLSCEEKKTLYRTSFRQTFAEMEAPTGKWKTHLGRFLLNISLALWLFMGYMYFIEREFPESLCERKRRAVLRRQLLLRDNPITGYPAAWDYEADDWKKNVKNKGS